MNTENREPRRDILDRAAEALRNTAVPDGPPEDLVQETLARLRSEEHTWEANRLRERRRIMVRIARYGSLAATAAAVVVVLSSLWLMDRSAAPAFADVVAKVQKAKSVTFRMTQKLTPLSPTIHQKWYLQGDNIRLELLGPQGKSQDQAPVFEAFVVDYRNKKGMRLNFMEKTARPMPLNKKMPVDFNPIDSLRQAKDSDAKLIGNEDLHGRKMQVYEFTQLHVFGLSGKVKEGETAKLWVDAASGLPARMVVETLLVNGKGKSSLIFDDFQWNKPLPADLFKLEAPPGFKTIPAQPDLGDLEKRAQQAIKKVLPAVVAVSGAGKLSGPAKTRGAAFASGVIVTADGLVLSQYHVTHDLRDDRGFTDFEQSRKAGERMTVLLADGRECEAELLGADRTYDISLLRLVKPGPYPHVPLEDKAEVALGDWVLKIGHPGGYRPGRAAVVRLGRVLCRQEDTFVTDCLVTGGDSGGPFFDLDGRLVGIIRGGWLPDNLRSRALAASPSPLIRARWKSMLRGDIAKADFDKMSKSLKRLARADQLPTDQWTQGREQAQMWLVAAPKHLNTVAVQDGEAVVALGTVVGEDGLIVTKASALPATPTCRLTGGKVVPATVLGVEPKFDLALLKVPANGLPAVEWASSAAPAAGTFVAAFGQETFPLAIGIVSVPRRDQAGPFPAKLVHPPPQPALLPEVIGSAVQGRGYWVEYVQGNAEAAGIQPGDVILTIADVAVRRHADLAECVRGRWAGERVPVRLLRAGKPIQVNLLLRAERPPTLSFRRDDFPTFFEHDLPLTDRECGGPVVDLQDKALGITIARDAYGCSAIPADCVQRLLSELQSGRLAGNWVKPSLPAHKKAVPAAGKPVTLTLEELKQRLTERRERFKSLLVEYDLVTEAHVEPRLLIAWNLNHIRDWQERHRVGFAGNKLYTQLTRPGVMVKNAPEESVAPDPNAPPAVAAAVESGRQRAAKRKESGSIQNLFDRTGQPELIRSIFDGRDCFLWNDLQKRMDHVPSEHFYAPIMYLAGLGLRPIDPKPHTAIQRADQQQFWFPDNFAVYANCKIRPNEEQVDGASCVVIEAEREIKLDGKAARVTDRIWFDPQLGYAPRKWEQRLDGKFSSLRVNTEFEEFAPGCWLPWTATWTRGTPLWVAPELRDRPAYTYNMRLRKARVNDVPDTLFRP
ncbi:MAG TPA: trypsin-like peptidase domain-containing protein [Gemmataceae bacterium]|nr:trypsin-like peptidase domain-containing protein [Gemmataceae bacterium]